MALDPYIRAVGFDMDGTFMDTHVDYKRLADTICDALIEVGIPEDAIDRSRGSKTEIDCGVQWLRKNGRANRIPDMIRRVGNAATGVELENAGSAKPFPGSLELLDRLNAMGYKTGILTRGGHDYATRVLRDAGVLDRFDTVVARDDYPEEQAKPSPKSIYNLGNLMGVVPREILYLGDSSIDWMAAHGAGARFIGVLSGGSTYSDWMALDKNIETVDSVRSLLDML